MADEQHDREQTDTKRTLRRQSLTGADVRTGMRTMRERMRMSAAKVQAQRRDRARQVRQFARPRSLFSRMYTPNNMRRAQQPLTAPPAHASTPNLNDSPRVHGASTSVPWASELAKIVAPKLAYVEDDDIMAFQIQYLDYTENIERLAERYDTDIEPRTVYDCIDKRALYYLCTMSDLVPVSSRGNPSTVSHAVIMNFDASGRTGYARKLKSLPYTQMERGAYKWHGISWLTCKNATNRRWNLEW